MKARVPKYGAPQQFVTVDTEATKGATIGVNVYDADGNLWREPAPAAASSDYPVTVWDKLQSVPVNVRAVASLATDGVVRKAGDAWTASLIVNADLAGADTDGLDEGATNLYYTPERVRDVMGTALVAGSNVTITVNDPGDTITIAATGGGGGSGSLIKLGEVVVTSATTDIDFTGLDLDAHGEYEIRLYDIPNAAGGRSIFLYYNTDYTSSNYSNRYIGNDGAAPFGNGGNSAEIAAHGNSSVIVGGRLSIQLSKSAGHRAYAYSHLARHSGSAFGNITYAHQWYASTANVTAIKLRCSVANGFGVGTRARLYRLA